MNMSTNHWCKKIGSARQVKGINLIFADLLLIHEKTLLHSCFLVYLTFPISHKVLLNGPKPPASYILRWTCQEMIKVKKIGSTHQISGELLIYKTTTFKIKLIFNYQWKQKIWEIVVSWKNINNCYLQARTTGIKLFMELHGLGNCLP